MDLPHERTGEAHDGAFPLTVVGARLVAGQAAPAFALDCLDATGMRTVTLADGHGRVRVLNVLNSIDTPVCDAQTRELGALLGDDEGVDVLSVSMDLPFALARWTAATGSRHTALSSHRNEDFGRDYGVLIKEWRALQRSVFVIDGAGALVHAQYVADQASPPDYAAAVFATRGARSR